MNDESHERIETSFGEVLIADGIIVLTMKQGLLLDESHVGEADRLIASFAEHGRS